MMVLTAGQANAAGPCAELDAKTCGDTALERYYQEGRSPEIMAMLDASCRGGHARACTAKGWARASRLTAWTGDGSYATEKAGQRADFLRGCELGHAHGCTAVGVSELNWPPKRKPDLSLVEDYFGQGCEGGDSMGCRLLGDLYYRDTDRSPRRTESAALYERACEGRDARACTALAVMVDAGLLDESNFDADALLAKACEHKEAGACALIGLEDLMEGDRSQLRTLKESCNKNSAAACAALGHAYVLGFGNSSDVHYGKALLNKACRSDSGLRCHYRGCERESPLACRWYGDALASENDKAAVRLSREVYRQACDMGDAVSCEAMRKK